MNISQSAPTNPDRLHFLDNLRAVAIIMVVGVHSLSYCLTLTNDAKAVISFIVHAISVPIFFLVDGYIFARSNSSNKKYSYRKSIIRSINRLIVPWLIFSLTYFIARYYFELHGAVKEQVILGKSIPQLLTVIYGSVHAPQLYFLLSLFIIRSCNPIFRLMLNIRNLYLLILLFFSLAIYHFSAGTLSNLLSIKNGQEPVLHALWGAQFYFMGIILFKGLHLIPAKKVLIPSLAIFCSLLFASIYVEINSLLIQYFYLLCFFMIFLMVNDKFNFLSFIGKNTMGIYLLHSPIVIKAASIVLNKIISQPLLNYFLLVFVTLVSSLITTVLLKRLPFGDWLFGESKRKFE